MGGFDTNDNLYLNITVDIKVVVFVSAPKLDI